MPPRNWRIRIQDILGAISKIERYTAGLSFESFAEDEKTVDAVLRNIEVIGEAARHVPDIVRARYPTVNWRQVAGMRNVVIHQYPTVDLEIVWDTVVNDLPHLAGQLTDILKRESDQALDR